MNIFTKDLNVPCLFKNYRYICIHVEDRCYTINSYPIEPLMKDRSRGVPRAIIGDSAAFFKENHLPDYLHEFYPRIDMNIKKCSVSVDRYKMYQSILPCEDLESYVVNDDDVIALFKLFKERVPKSFAKISKDTASRFIKILNEENGFDVSEIHFVPTYYEVRNPGKGWNERLEAQKYIVTDNMLNPIDVNALIDIINKIVVDD